MKPQINPILFRHELRRLLWNKVTLAQMFYTHAIMCFVALTTALPGRTCDSDVWISYTLFYGLSVALMFNSISGGYLFVRPKIARVLDAVLASPLSLPSYVATSALACLLFNAVNFALHMVLMLALRQAGPPSWKLLPAALCALALGALLLILLARFTLTAKDPGQGQIVMMFLTIGTLVAGSLVVTHIKPGAGYLCAGAVVLLALLPVVWRLAINTLGKEAVVLS